MSVHRPYEYLTELAAVFRDEDTLAELAPEYESIKHAADQLIAGCPFPLTANTLYAMNYGVLYNFSIVEATNPFVQAVQRAMGAENSLMGDDGFMLVLAEVARRILDGELETPEMTL